MIGAFSFDDFLKGIQLVLIHLLHKKEIYTDILQLTKFPFFCFRRLEKLTSEEATVGNWDVLIDPVLFSIRTTKSCTTKMTPFQLMHGREARRPIEIDESGNTDDLSNVRCFHLYRQYIQLHQLLTYCGILPSCL